MIKMLKHSSSRLMASRGWGMSQHLAFFKELAPGSLAILPCVYGQHKVDLVGGFVGLFGRMWGEDSERVGGWTWTWEELKASVIGVRGILLFFLKPDTAACPWNFNIGSRNRRVLRSCLPVVLGKSVSSQFSERLLLKK